VARFGDMCECGCDDLIYASPPTTRRDLDLPYKYCINSCLLALQHDTSLTLKFLYFTETTISSAISARDCEAVARMPCGHRDHEHPPWPQQGTHQFVIEACENHCGWCNYRTKSANNLRVVSHFPPWRPPIHIFDPSTHNQLAC
jgi:hypothetical protein